MDFHNKCTFIQGFCGTGKTVIANYIKKQFENVIEINTKNNLDFLKILQQPELVIITEDDKEVSGSDIFKQLIDRIKINGGTVIVIGFVFSRIAIKIADIIIFTHKSAAVEFYNKMKISDYSIDHIFQKKYDCMVLDLHSKNVSNLFVQI